jgi:tetratricopeptide (TPR) repeat protein
MKKHQCVNCDSYVNLVLNEDGIVAIDCALSINYPGLICEQCVDDILDTVPDPPGLICVRSISEDEALAALLEIQFIQGLSISVDFFLSLFPMNSTIIDAAAVRLHQEGEKNLAYSLLEHGIKNSDDPDSLRIEMAALSGMDGAASLGLKFLEEVENKKTERYYTIKGNLFRLLNEWDNAAECWNNSIVLDQMEIIPWFNLGYYFTQVQQNHLAAESHYKKACALFPNERRFRAYLGDTYFFQDKPKEALEQYNLALSIEDEDEQFEASIRRMMQQCE